MMITDQPYWLQKLATLRIDRARDNPAPHKPLLLLVILEMVENGEITSRELPLSPALAFLMQRVLVCCSPTTQAAA
jgi:putative restriction endonuclease